MPRRKCGPALPAEPAVPPRKGGHWLSNSPRVSPPLRTGKDAAAAAAPARGLEQLLSREEVARLLGISTWSLWTLCSQGKIRHVRIGRLVRFRPADVERFIEGRSQGGDDKASPRSRR